MPWEGRFFVNVLKDIFVTVENSLKDKIKEIFSTSDFGWITFLNTESDRVISSLPYKINNRSMIDFKNYITNIW